VSSLFLFTVVVDVDQSDAGPPLTSDEVNQRPTECRAVREHVDAAVVLPLTGGARVWIVVTTSLDVRQLDG